VSKVLLTEPDADAPNECAVTYGSLSAAPTRRPMTLDGGMTLISSRPTKVMPPATSALLS
jgi:hypothetical protein